MYVMLFLCIYVLLFQIPLNDAHCIDIHHHIVSQGLHYVPGPNPCTLCICDKGNPKWCKQVLCSPPQNCKSFQVGNSCCEFKCLDDILSKSDNYSETYDLVLRLIASAVTAVLSLSLLFFLIHRLRQRKIRLRQNRQLSEDQRSLNSIGYITGSLGYLPGSIGYLGSGNNELEFHYDESNVHYPLWKPPGNYFPRGEAPPPYEEAVRAARTEAEMVSNHQQVNPNSAPYTFSSNRNENVSLTLVHNTHVSITPSVQQTGVSSSQCNVMLHQSNNVQSVQAESRNDPSTETVQQQNPTANSSTSVSLACGAAGSSHDYVIDSSSSFLQNTTLESQVDVHYENCNHKSVTNVAPVLTVSVKNEESFPKKSLNVDFLRERIDRNSYVPADGKSLDTNSGTAEASNELYQLKNEPSALSCSSSWRREALQHNTSASKSNVNITYGSDKQKIIEKSRNFKITESSAGGSGSSKNYHRVENQLSESKVKKCNVMLKDSSKTSKALVGRQYDKQRTQSDCHSVESRNEIISEEKGKHRTIPQKFSKTLGILETEICYVNATDVGKRKQLDEDINDHCDLILKQHNGDKYRYIADKLDKKVLEKTSCSTRNSMCSTSAEVQCSQRGSATGTGIDVAGLLKGDVSAHRTLPKNLRELSEAFYLNFDNSVCEEMSLNCLMKKTLPRNSGSQAEIPLTSTCAEKPVKTSDTNSTHSFSNSSTVGRKYLSQDKKSSSSSAGSSSNNNMLKSSCYRNQTNVVKNTEDKSELSKEKVAELNKDRSCVSYHCLSPTQDDVDDYRSECENCKSLSFEDCNDEQGDLLNETMTLQRRPMEQGEEHLFYRTSLTLPSHNKKTARSVALNTPRESWFMAMQEITSSSESD